MGTVFRLNSELPTPEAGTKIVKADEYSAVLEAGDLIKAAQKQADEIIQAAQRTYEQRYQQGYDDGVEAGKMENALKMMETVVASVEFIENIEKTVVSVVNQSVKKIIENFDDEERIKGIVNTALNHVRGQQKVTVRVHPKDEPIIAKMLALQTIGSYITVVADGHLQPDSCILESDVGVIDASLKTQLKTLEAAFSAKIKQ